MAYTNYNNLIKIDKYSIHGYILMIATLLLSPFYFYSNGSPQPAHILIFLTSMSVLFINKLSVFKFFKLHKSAGIFLCLLLFINLYYFTSLQNSSFLINSCYWLFNYIFFISLVILIQKKAIDHRISLLIVFKFSLIIFSYLAGWGSYTYWPRYDYFFNSPNQLAYFAICLFLAYIALVGLKVNFAFALVYSMLILIIISSGGRSAYFALAPLIIILIWGLRKKFLFLFLIASIPLIVSIGFTFFKLPNFSPNQLISSPAINLENISNAVNNLNSNELKSLSTNVAGETIKRIFNLTFDRDDHLDSIVLQLSARGYLRALEHPVYLLFGAGQGYDERFIDRYGYVYEIHSSVFAIFFYYGIFGLIFFSIFIWQIFNVKINLLFLTPIIAYGLFTYGLRSPYFWFSLAFLSTAPNLFKLITDDLNN